MSRPIEAPPPPRSPWQRFYGAAHGLRERWWRSRAARLPRPVVSIGNLCWGGGGKTPLVAAVAEYLRDRGRRVAILSRGYGSQGEGVRIVSRGQGPLLGPRLAGDEPVLLAGQLPGVAVIVSPDRYLAGQHALQRLDPAPDLFLLDDGFSHLRLTRDLDLLVFPAADPFAGGRLLPSGRLREPLASSRRAHAVLLSGAGDDSAGDALAHTLRRHGFAGSGFASRTVPQQAVTVPEGRPLDPGTRVLVVSGIARPESFLDTVRGMGFDVAHHLAYGDHHPYTEATLEEIERDLERHGAQTVLTTSKDRVKLQGRFDLPLAEIPIRARPESDFFRWLDHRLAELAPGSHQPEGAGDHRA